MYLAYWVMYGNNMPRGAIAEISDEKILLQVDGGYYELHKILWNVNNDDMGIIRGVSGEKDIVNFSRHSYMKTFTVLSDAVKYVVQEMFQ